MNAPLRQVQGRSQETLTSLFGHDEFHRRHIGPSPGDEAAMLAEVGCASRAALVDETIPPAIRLPQASPAPGSGEPVTEAAALAELAGIAADNQAWRSYIGAGYHGTITPEPIRRNVLENPGWYTAYTPYQAEISQGRLEALLNFQQMVIDLTGLPVANASLLDEATAAAEGMTLIRRSVRSATSRYFVESGTHPQVIAVIRTRAAWMGIEIEVGPVEALDPARVFGAHLQTPDTEGRVRDFSGVIAALHTAGARACVGTDLLASLLVKSAGAQGADVAIGSAQRFGVPLGYGGPHAAFMAVQQPLVRMLPGRLIGVSRDAAGRPAFRMALQTREQHIRRDKATSNICTAQALLANMASFYAVYHGPDGLRRIALRTHAMARLLARVVAGAVGRDPRAASFSTPVHSAWFDTVCFDAGGQVERIVERAAARQINLRPLPGGRIAVAFDETVGLGDVADVACALTGVRPDSDELRELAAAMPVESDVLTASLVRDDPVLTHPVFNRYHSETDFVRYLKKLENRDISLVHSMIPLGSCTMKLNAASEMAPISWPSFADIHPFAPASQAQGYATMLAQLGGWLASLTGFAAVSFQPNSGAQGEYAGLLAIRRYQAAQAEGHRDVCLIPSSAHGTNPASAQMMGLRIVVVACDAQGNIDLADLAARVEQHRDRLSALMVTYPSTHGVFEDGIREACALVHRAGGQVYMDGANMNAQAGLTSPGHIGADVCHLNLHKTFCIPHGGGGPGMGPIAVASHLAPYLPEDPFTAQDDAAVSAAPHGSALITTISWMYIRMMGSSGIRKATEVAILNANYIAARLAGHYDILFTGANGRVAHECILDLRHFKSRYGITAEDVAKRLMDFGYHAPTLSFPVPDTLMVEPTESEGKAELDRFCDAMIAIRQEVADVHAGRLPADDNPLVNAPHTAVEIAGEWSHPYSREQAAFPLPWVKEAKVWPAVKRIDNAGGDRNLVCTCPPLSDYAE
ncbi:MAG: aminomethyl-transferring glycine dehydrogenase [Burkholderiaceae bacterium]|nr:aminomethyl-transferring glycine dehydrogenase [Burkholderiaceae bacterium]